MSYARGLTDQALFELFLPYGCKSAPERTLAGQALSDAEFQRKAIAMVPPYWVGSRLIKVLSNSHCQE
jgi:hypothetical protein